MSKKPDKCNIPNCRKQADLYFYNFGLCDDDYEKYTLQELKKIFGIKDEEIKIKELLKETEKIKENTIKEKATNLNLNQWS